MPQPITRTASSAARPVPRQRNQSRPPLLRHLREQEWRTMVGTYRLLSRLIVERSKHHLVDEADDYARQATAVEEELERLFALRWARRRPNLLLEQARWWSEPHEDDPLNCRFCQLQIGNAPERTSLSPLRRD
ncbi:hypothetical protein [Modestobacter caceresii]|jgi:hypothetical protein|uniref:hypothetical protein n=1 Tax=Modestobacter caceresii TaxID=1522368 RepID=UPI0012DFF86C|nr:hypothetical protein [Modestobacter caceresii]